MLEEERSAGAAGARKVFLGRRLRLREKGTEKSEKGFTGHLKGEL